MTRMKRSKMSLNEVFIDEFKIITFPFLRIPYGTFHNVHKLSTVEPKIFVII